MCKIETGTFQNKVKQRESIKLEICLYVSVLGSAEAKKPGYFLLRLSSVIFNDQPINEEWCYFHAKVKITQLHTTTKSMTRLKTMARHLIWTLLTIMCLDFGCASAPFWGEFY